MTRKARKQDGFERKLSRLLKKVREERKSANVPRGNYDPERETFLIGVAAGMAEALNAYREWDDRRTKRKGER